MWWWSGRQNWSMSFIFLFFTEHLFFNLNLILFCRQITPSELLVVAASKSIATYWMGFLELDSKSYNFSGQNNGIRFIIQLWMVLSIDPVNFDSTVLTFGFLGLRFKNLEKKFKLRKWDIQILSCYRQDKIKPNVKEPFVMFLWTKKRRIQSSFYK